MVSEKTRFPQHAAQIVRFDLDIYSEHFEFCAGSALSLDYGYPQFLLLAKIPGFCLVIRFSDDNFNEISNKD